MQFDISNTKATLIHYSPRAEIHGPDKVPAGDLKVRADLTNDSLALFHPTLKHMLFCKDAPANADLADQATTDEKFVRFPQLPMLKWDGEIKGATVTIHQGISPKADIVLDLCDVDNFSIEPKQGGTVTVTFRIQAHPDEKQSGKLCGLIGTDIEISVDSPKAEEE